MTRAEIISLIKTLLATYPNNGITDVKSLVNGWEMIFAEDDAKAVYKACRLHMSTNKWFPKPSEIKERLPYTSNLYENSPRTAPRLESDTSNDINTGCDICPYNGDMCIGYDKCNL